MEACSLANHLHTECSHPKIHMLNPNSWVIILGGGALGCWCCHKDRTLLCEITALMKETPEDFPHPFYHAKTQ